MGHSKFVLTWCFRAVWREDPALRRFRSLEASRQGHGKPPVPVFAARKPGLAFPG
jgi:hypothetical protein